MSRQRHQPALPPATGNCGLNATLDVPSHTAVDLTSGGGNMQVSGIQGNVTLDSAAATSGSRDRRPATVQTGGGNLTASDLGGILKFTTSGGDVDGTACSRRTSPRAPAAGTSPWCSPQVPDFVKVSSSGGDITIVVPRGNTSYAITSNASGGDYSASVPNNDAARPRDPGGQRRRQHQHRRGQLTACLVSSAGVS